MVETGRRRQLDHALAELEREAVSEHLATGAIDKAIPRYAMVFSGTFRNTSVWRNVAPRRMSLTPYRGTSAREPYVPSNRRQNPRGGSGDD